MEKIYSKQCTNCKEFKQLSDFHNRKDTIDKKEFACKKCRNNKYKTKYVKKRLKSAMTKEQKAERRRQQYSLNPEKYKEINKKWVLKNKDKRLAYSRAFIAERRIRLIKATIIGEIEDIREFYKRCPLGYHVDHIVPLKGKNVSGLHSLCNLQYLPAKENLKKGNKFEGL